MFSITWNKYMPVIRILMKKAGTGGEQVLAMNQTDFNRAAGGRKIKYTFQVKIRRGRLQDAAKASAIALELLDVISNDETTRQLIRENDYDLQMNNQYQLTISHIAVNQEDIQS